MEDETSRVVLIQTGTVPSVLIYGQLSFYGLSKDDKEWGYIFEYRFNWGRVYVETEDPKLTATLYNPRVCLRYETGLNVFIHYGEITSSVDWQRSDKYRN